MERIVELEHEHVIVHNELLKTLDKLHLAQQERGQLDNEMERTLEIRRHFQMSLDKSSAILRALERLSISKDKEQGSTNNTEYILAERLRKLMQDNYQMDEKIASFLEKEKGVSAELRQERKGYCELVDKLKVVAGKANTDQSDAIQQKDHQEVAITTTDDSAPEQKKGIEMENEVIEELLIALKIHGGYDPFM